ncbi:MAG: hypothetical protein DMG64_11535 [Acidobacteria bacterium]|nr:MAG: hypothetical protein DMG63_06795 [Acidobacteriota bacterium]PYY02455.1 MAG: hypothetical protein DMG64_11535 [Acidobacteriota bacterium]
MKEFKTEQCTANRGFTTGPTKVLSRRMRAGLILFRVNRRTLSVVLILVLCIPAAAFFIAVPQWQIEHPGDPTLILRTERHWLWRAPARAHLESSAIIVPVLAIAFVAGALLAVALYQE